MQSTEASSMGRSRASPWMTWDGGAILPAAVPAGRSCPFPSVWPTMWSISDRHSQMSLILHSRPRPRQVTAISEYAHLNPKSWLSNVPATTCRFGCHRHSRLFVLISLSRAVATYAHAALRRSSSRPACWSASTHSRNACTQYPWASCWRGFEQIAPFWHPVVDSVFGLVAVG